MRDQSQIADDETILKRISPGNDQIKPKGQDEYRATSFAIQPRPTEEYPSWSRRKLTSPSQLLEIEARKGRDISNWRVAEAKVSAVRSLGLDVVPADPDEDPGHCYIVPTREQKFSSKIWKKLAKETRIVYP